MKGGPYVGSPGQTQVHSPLIWHQQPYIEAVVLSVSTSRTKSFFTSITSLLHVVQQYLIFCCVRTKGKRAALLQTRFKVILLVEPSAGLP
jgi:hypothetical protein